MIIWLASYPKSGNTWVRVLISNIINYEKIDFENPFGFTDQIESYPNIKHFVSLDKDFNNPDDVVPNWIKTQNLLNLDNKIKIFKTHNMFGSFGKHSFTDLNNTAGVIHIVRDPRNVISSINNHFHHENMDASIKFMFDKNKWVYNVDKNDGVSPNFISSWGMHYFSWKNFPKNYLLIKYEDLLRNPMNEIKKIYNYLKKFFNLNLKDENFDKIIKLSSFKNLKNKENEGKFEENVKNLKTKKKINFFDSGPSNDWKKKLDERFRNDLEKEFTKEMKELGYI